MSDTAIVHLASEARPWATSGGLAEVAASLSAAQHEAGQETWLLLPGYRQAHAEVLRRGARLRDTGVGGAVRLPVGEWRWRALRIDQPGRPVVLIDCPDLFDRDGLYHGADHRAFGDNALRFAVFVRAALEAAPQLCDAPLGVLHAHDWQAALGPYQLATDPPPGWGDAASVFTIHNLGYPGRFPMAMADELGIPQHHRTPEGLEFHGDLALIKAGVAYADAVTTVSPSYAREIQTERHGEGLDGLMRHVSERLFGVLNGIDAAWSPAHDPHIAARYSADDLMGKAACRAALLDRFGLEADASTPVFGSVSRFAWQKGIDLIAEVVPTLVSEGARLIMLGSGDPGLEARLNGLAAAFPRHVALHIGYDVALSHQIEAGVDAFLMPSRYEPCGLNQLYSMAYGTLPIVHRTGGLADTVVPVSEATLADGSATGFGFEHADAQGLRWAIAQACALFRDSPEAWRQVQRAGMTRDFSWDAAAAAYDPVYAAAQARAAQRARKLRAGAERAGSQPG